MKKLSYNYIKNNSLIFEKYNPFFKYQLKFFNTTVPSQTNTNSPTQAPERTPEQIKIDNLMSQWPEYIRNPHPNHSELVNLKSKLETFYKFYNGDKAAIYMWDMPPEIQILAGLDLEGSLTNDSIVQSIKLYEGFVTTESLFKKFEHIANIKDMQPSTYSVLIPILKHYMMKFDRHNINELYLAVAGACKMYLADNEFWDIVENKLIGDKLYRYLSVEQSVNLADFLITAERGSNSLIKALEVTIIKHRRAVFSQKKLLKIAKKAFEKKGSDIIKAALEDPNIEVPGIDVDSLLMSLRPDHEKQSNERKLLH